MKFWEWVKGVYEGDIEYYDEFKAKYTLKDWQDIKMSETIKPKDRSFITEGGSLADIKILIDSEIEITNKRKTRWKPQYGNAYYTIDRFKGVVSAIWTDAYCNIVDYRRENCFETEKEARDYLEYKQALWDIWQPFVYGEKNFYVCRMQYVDELVLGSNSQFEEVGTKYLGTDAEKATEFMNKWEKEILKYEFGIEEEEDDSRR